MRVRSGSQSIRRWAILRLVFVAAAVAVAGRAAFAQQVELLYGEPFGVGRVTFATPDDLGGDPWADGRLDITEKNGRLLYPVLATGPVRELFREFVQAPPGTTVLFLFTGREPLDLTIHTPAARSLRATPTAPRRGRFNGLLNSWWRDYSRTARRHDNSSDYPALVDTYLASTLARRLGLRQPQAGGVLSRPEVDRGLALILGAESLRNRLEDEVLSGAASGEAGANNVPVPAEPRLPEVELPEPPAEVAIEPIARHVPADCFYLRCGTFDNYVWMRSTLDEWGGDLRNLFAQRGLDYRLNERNERQLALKETVLSRTLGGTLISDVAIIGTDPFFREGASLGILFEARNNVLLSNSIAQQRSDAIAREKGTAQEREVELAGRKVKFLSTPDGAVRSYYVVVGDYHLVTTSRTLARRFIEIEKGKGSLGESREFRLARARLPLSREDTLFVYLSREFLNQLASPAYRIEMWRRLRSAVEIDAVRLARLAAAAEKKPNRTIQQLVAAEMLPEGFGRRADGSRLVLDGDRVTDSVRGTSGYFLPVPDVEVASVSPDEAADYQRFVRTYGETAAQLDPVIAAVKRFRTKVPGQERVRIEAYVTPLGGGKYAWLMRFLGEPTRQKVAAVDSDLVRVEGMGQGGNYLFLGIQDINLPADGRAFGLRALLPALNSILTPVEGGVRVQPNLRPPAFDAVRGYLGGAPTLGLVEGPLRLLQGGLAGPPDAAGYARYVGGLWQRVFRGMTIVSFDRALLDRVTPQLALEEARRPAQLRARIADLSQDKVAAGVNALAYARAREVSFGNAGLLQSLSRQLHVKREDCLKVAEALLGARLVCPLGGKFEFRDDEGERAAWVSTAWAGGNRAASGAVPDDYVAPVMQWFRGLDAEFSAQRQMLVLRAEVGLQHKPAGGGFVLPGFLFPGGAVPAPGQSPKVEELPPIEELPPPEPRP